MQSDWEIERGGQRRRNFTLKGDSFFFVDMELNDGSSGMPTEAVYASVDPFLIEVLQDFRHRLTG